MGKYDPLTDFLKGHSTSEVPMKFEEVARVIGSKLPPSAYRHRPWWANESAGHIHAKAWLAAGFEATQVDMVGKKLVFKRKLTGMAEEPREFEAAPGSKQRRRHPLIGAMKGTFTIEPGWDLTRPALDPEELAEWEANIERTADMIEAAMKSKKE